LAISTAVSRPSAPGQPRSFGRGRRKVSLRVAMRLSAARRNSSLIGAKRINRALRIILLFQSHRCSQFCPEGCAIKSIVCPWSASRRTKPGRQVADKSRFAWSRCRLSNPRERRAAIRRRPFHRHEAGALEMLDDAVGDHARHDLARAVDAPSSAEMQRKSDRGGAKTIASASSAAMAGARRSVSVIARRKRERSNETRTRAARSPHDRSALSRLRPIGA